MKIIYKSLGNDQPVALGNSQPATASFSNSKSMLVRDILIKNKIRQKEVYELLETYGDNIDYFENHLVCVVINHTTKSGFLAAKSNTYAGFYSYVHFYHKKILEMENKYHYKIDSLFAKDGFPLYKEKPEDDLYKIVFSYNKDSPLLYDKYFSASTTIENTVAAYITEYKIDVNNTIGVYYRGTDKYKEIKLPDIASYFSIIDKEDEKYKIMVQTDQQQILDMFVERYKDRIVFIDDIERTTNNQGIHLNQKTNKINSVIRLNASLNILIKCRTLIITNESNVSYYIKNKRRGSFHGVN